MGRDETHVEVAGERVRVSSPGRVVFPDRGWTKLDVVEHFVRVAPGVARVMADRPSHLKRWPKGLAGKPFHQRRTRSSTDVRTTRMRFASAQPGEVWTPRGAADVVRMAQLGAIDLHPWPTRLPEPDRPDELRIDLDPTPGATFAEVRQVALVVRGILEDDGLVGWPKTSGSRGIHVYVRIAPRWSFHEVRRAVLAIGREAERRHPRATTAWWKEERDGVFIDFNQMCRDRTVAAAWSVRATGCVSTPLTWDEVDGVEVEDFPMDRSGERWTSHGDVHAPMEAVHHDIGPTLERVARDEREHGLGEAPWPPNYPKQPGEPPRVAPSRAADHGDRTDSTEHDTPDHDTSDHDTSDHDTPDHDAEPQ